MNSTLPLIILIIIITTMKMNKSHHQNNTYIYICVNYHDKIHTGTALNFYIIFIYNNNNSNILRHCSIILSQKKRNSHRREEKKNNLQKNLSGSIFLSVFYEENKTVPQNIYTNTQLLFHWLAQYRIQKLYRTHYTFKIYTYTWCFWEKFPSRLCCLSQKYDVKAHFSFVLILIIFIFRWLWSLTLRLRTF